MFRRSKTHIAISCILTLALVTPAIADDRPVAPERSTVLNNLGGMPLAFTQNNGQWPDSVLFRANAGEANMWITKNGIWYQLFRKVEKANATATAMDPSAERFDALPGKFSHERDSIETTMIKAEFVGANEAVEVLGIEKLEYKCNYFIGNDPSKWRSDVPNYGAVTMRGLYQGVDVTFSTRDGRLQEEMIASSSEALAQVQVEYRGANGVTLLSETNAIVQTSLGKHEFAGVLLSDGLTSKQERQVATATSSAIATGVSLVYSTFLGGNGDDFGQGIAVDPAGAAYVAGYTISSNFPTLDPVQGTIQGDYDVFVTKLNSAGNSLVYSTYLGGGAFDGVNPNGIAVDADGAAYIMGTSYSNDFPTLNPFQTFQDSSDVYVTKLSSAGNSLIYSTYLGGSDHDRGIGLAVDDAGAVYVSGRTFSTNFPMLNSFQGTIQGDWDAFVTKLSSDGSSLVYSTYLGGSGFDRGWGVAVDISGAAYVTGETSSGNFPTLNPYQSTNQGSGDAFVTKLSSTGNTLEYSTYIGSPFHGLDQYNDYGLDIAVDASGAAYVTGETNSFNFPTLNPYQTANLLAPGYYHAFVTKLSSAGSSLVYSTYLGGNNQDFVYGIDVDAAGAAYVAGFTLSTNFPTLNPYQSTNQGTEDAFVTKLSSTGNSLIYSTYLGGSGANGDACYSIAVDAFGAAYVTGETGSQDFPTLNPFQSTIQSFADAFVTKIVGCSESDSDCDGVTNDVDNCPTISNPGQADTNNDGIGDACCCLAATGNVDCDPGDGCDISDLSALIDNLYISFTPLCCPKEANVDGQPGIDISDLSALIDYLYISFTLPAVCQ